MFEATKLNAFLSALAIDRGHLGLVVTFGDPAALRLPHTGVEMVEVDVATAQDPDLVLETLVEAGQARKWCRLNVLDAAFPAKVYNQLRQLSTTGHIDISALGSSGDTVEGRWPAESKVLVVVQAATLEKLEISTLLDLFGPILRES